MYENLRSSASPHVMKNTRFAPSFVQYQFNPIVQKQKTWWKSYDCTSYAPLAFSALSFLVLVVLLLGSTSSHHRRLWQRSKTMQVLGTTPAWTEQEVPPDRQNKSKDKLAPGNLQVDMVPKFSEPPAGVRREGTEFSMNSDVISENSTGPGMRNGSLMEPGARNSSRLEHITPL